MCLIVMPPSLLCQLYVYLMVILIPLREAGHTEELSLDQISLGQIMVQVGDKTKICYFKSVCSCLHITPG